MGSVRGLWDFWARLHKGIKLGELMDCFGRRFVGFGMQGSGLGFELSGFIASGSSAR